MPSADYGNPVEVCEITNVQRSAGPLHVPCHGGPTIYWSAACPMALAVASCLASCMASCMASCSVPRTPASEIVAVMTQTPNRLPSCPFQPPPSLNPPTFPSYLSTLPSPLPPSSRLPSHLSSSHSLPPPPSRRPLLLILC